MKDSTKVTASDIVAQMDETLAKDKDFEQVSKKMDQFVEAAKVAVDANPLLNGIQSQKEAAIAGKNVHLIKACNDYIEREIKKLEDAIKTSLSSAEKEALASSTALEDVQSALKKVEATASATIEAKNELIKAQTAYLEAEKRVKELETALAEAESDLTEKEAASEAIEERVDEMSSKITEDIFTKMKLEEILSKS